MSAEMSVERLLAETRAEAALDDFGDAWFLAPLGRLVAEINAQGGLTSPDSAAGARIRGALVDRLRLVRYFKDHPEAADETVDLACAIVGLPRTGSTALHRLLASSPRLTALWWWETAFPLPFPDEAPGDPAPRQEAARQMVEWLLAEWPDFESIDPMDAMAVNEEVVLLDRTFLSTTYDSMLPIHDYGRWQAVQDHTPAYRDLYRMMQAIQHQRAARGERRRPWVFKTPHHLLGGMDGLLAVWPGVRLVMTHRHVGEVLPSYCSMCASLSTGSSSSYRRADQGAHWTRRFADGLKRFAALRTRLPATQVIDVLYGDTVRDPLGTAERTMRALGLGFDVADRAAMEACVEANRREARPRHKYDAAEFGLSPEGIARDFAAYHDAFLSPRRRPE